MSKEEGLLELVLDNFSNIKEVLNATKDIENFLIKLKLNRKRGIGVILKKTKNLVDSLFEHSVKVKDEFYKHYNELENVPIEKEGEMENVENETEENVSNVIETENSETNENSNESRLEETNDSEVSESDNTVKSKNKDGNTESTIVENERDEIESTVVENEAGAVIDCNNIEENEETNIEDTLDNTAEEKNYTESLSEDPLGLSENSDVTENILDNNAKSGDKDDDTTLERNNSDSNSSEEFSTKIDDSNIIESSILKKSKGNIEEELDKNDDKHCDVMHVKSEPKALIRLVDLSKLIDPKPKKSVKFDSSVIILTSSDEESKTPKKKSDGRDQNGKLKSALKNSPSNNRDAKITSKNNKEKRGKQNKDSECEVVETLTKKNKKNENSSDSDVQEVPIEKSKMRGDEVRKNKRNAKKDKENSEDTEELRKELIKSKSLRSSETKRKNSSSDSDESNIDNKKNVEQFPKSNSRKSSRIDNKLNMKQNRRENLRKIFKRKSTKFGRSNFEIINDKLKNDSSDSDSDSNTINRKSSRRKKSLQEEHLSDTSSLSDDEIKNVELKKKFKNSKKRKYKFDLPIDVENDKKFTYKVHIPLPRIECNQLKDIYLKNKDILEIKSLTKVDLSKSSKRSHITKNDSKLSSDAEKPKSKKSKRNISKDKSSSENEQVTDDEPVMNVADVDENVDKNIDESKKLENKDEQMVAIIMDKLKNSEEKKISEDDGSDSEEEGNEKSKKKKNGKKEKNNKSNDEDNKEKDKNSEDEEKSSKGEHSDSSGEKDKPDKNKDKDVEDKKITDNENKSEDDKEKSDSDNSSNDEKKKSKKKWRSDKLLTTKIDSTDSEEEFSKYCKKKEKPREEIMRKVKKRGKKAIVLSDSEDSHSDKKASEEDSDDESEKSDDEKSSSGNEREKNEEKKKRKRIKRTRDSSSSDDDKSTRKQIRRLIGKDSLSETTKQAEAEEKERKARIIEKQKKYNKFFEAKSDSKVEKVILDFDEKKNKELLSVHKGLVKKLKPHQASGVQFMWDACFESLERTKSTKGSGCILAHCMGLGKTLQVIALSHTLLINGEQTGVTKIMVVCPLNTVLNWKAEFKKWLPKEDLEIYELVSCKQNYERQYIVQEWHRDGGVLIIGYHMFRNLSNPDNKRISKKMRTTFQEGFLDPGPDLVICDEGHLLKNEKTNLSIAMNRIKTARRIVLTGTPLQNNLKEYWCMVQFIKPNLLGTYKEYLNRFVNPIINGQYTDSTQHDILLMRKRSHVLHKLLDGVVQRRDYAVLEPYLPPKFEYVLFIALTETQVKLYKHYMEKFARQNDGSNRTSFLFTDFQNLQRMCTHPRVLLDKTVRKEKEFDTDSEGSLKDFIDDDGESSDSSSNSSSSKSNSGSEDSDKDKKGKKSKSQQKIRVTRAQAAQRKENNEESDPEIEEVKKEWWQEYCDGEELDNINNSGKLFLLFQILKECEEIGDKILVFSQSLYTLNCIEYFLEKIDEATQKGETDKVGGHTGSWSIGLDYFRLDGSSSCDNRASWCDMFNNPNNIRARLFLISTKAGGLGINLVAANRVIIFDVSWNPSHDIQSIYRVYRFGQTKPCYIYRFVAYGTMEMKIYERQVTKQAISKRVIDEQQIDRHYNQNDLQELYRCDLEPTERPIPLVPKDVLLGEMLQKYEKTIFKYHLHQSLLENKEAEGLNEEERKDAWEEFENEKVLRKNTNPGLPGFNNSFMNAYAIEAALASIVRKDNPSWSEVQIKGIIPALVQQLRVQLEEGDRTMYIRVQQEMQIMQALHAQKMKEAYYQQQVMRLIQQQEQQAKILGNMNINPTQFVGSQPGMLSNLLAQRQGGPSSAPSRPSDVIELND